MYLKAPLHKSFQMVTANVDVSKDGIVLGIRGNIVI